MYYINTIKLSGNPYCDIMCANDMRYYLPQHILKEEAKKKKTKEQEEQRKQRNHQNMIKKQG